MAIGTKVGMNRTAGKCFIGAGRITLKTPGWRSQNEGEIKDNGKEIFSSAQGLWLARAGAGRDGHNRGP
jgi:hypothetical protein